jgi:hypothetical protein
VLDFHGLNLGMAITFFIYTQPLEWLLGSVGARGISPRRKSSRSVKITTEVKNGGALPPLPSRHHVVAINFLRSETTTTLLGDTTYISGTKWQKYYGQTLALVQPYPDAERRTGISIF